MKQVKRWLRIMVIWLIIVLGGSELALHVYIDWFYQSPLPENIVHATNTDIFPNGLRDTSDPLEMTPNFVGTAPTGIQYAINELGYRDDPIEANKAYWIFLGDSTTFGLNITHEQTYPEQIERLAIADGLNVQSVNTAVPGRGTVSEYDTLQRTIQAGIQPQWIVVGFFANDVRNDVYYLQNDRTVPPSPLQTILNNVYLYRIGAAALEHVRDTQWVSHDQWNTIYDKTTNGQIDALLHMPEWQTTLAYMARIQKTANTYHAGMVLVYIPINEQEAISGQSNVADVLATWAAIHDVPFVNGAAVYADYVAASDTLPDGFYSSPGDMGHPGPLASQLLAQAVYEALVP